MNFKYLSIFFLISISTVVAQKPQKVAVVGFYNLENLFDTIDGPNNDAEYLPNGTNSWGTYKYMNKLENMSKVISMIGDSHDDKIQFNGPHFLGVCEVENRNVLEDLVKTPLLKDQNYEIVHFDSPDRRGVDVAFLYKSKYFKVLSAKAHKLVDYSDTTRRTRDQLLVSGLFDGDTLHFIVNHWPSRAAASPARENAALLCRSIVDSLLTINTNAKVFIMGDFNDMPNDKSLNYLTHKSVKKKPPTKEVIVLHNEGKKWHKQGRGTLAHNDVWQVFDMILTTPYVVNDTVGFRFHSAGIFDRPWMHQQDGRFKGYPLRTHAGGAYLNGYSDHLPVYMYIVK